jgi:hypothetical protein
VLNALTPGTAQGLADSVSDAVTSSYTKLEQLVRARFVGNKPAESELDEHATDPETWQGPLTKFLTAFGIESDEAIIAAAQRLLALLDPAGTAQGKYQVDLRGAQGVQVGDGNQQINTYNAQPYVMTPRPVQVRPGQPGNVLTFGSAYEAAGGRSRLGQASLAAVSSVLRRRSGP